MYKYDVTLFIRKTVAFFITFSLMLCLFSFNIDEFVKQDFVMLYNATSISDCYNSITNVSFNIINSILKSVNVVSVINSESSKGNNSKQDKKSKQKDNLYFNVQNSNNLKIVKNVFVENLFYMTTYLKSFVFERRKFYIDIFYFIFMLFGFCYAARGNIDNIINLNNLTKSFRLVL